MTTGWQVPDDGSEDAIVGPRPFLLSLHFLRAALIRRWRLCVGLGCAGMMLALSWTLLISPPSEGTASLYLAHESDADPAVAMDTDVTLLRTRTVAQSVIDDLGLDMTVEAFQSSLSATPVTSKVLTVTVAAPDDAAATARTESLTRNFLDFRSEQLRSQSEALTESYKQRISDLRDEARGLTAEDSSPADDDRTDEVDGSEGPSTASGSLTRRSEVSGEIDELTQSVATLSLETDSIARASQVMDSTSIVPQSPLRRNVLATFSGLIAGLAIGVGYIFFMALTTDRVRRRGEIALALEAPVRFGVGRVHRRRWWTPWRPRSGFLHERDLEILISGLEEGLSSCSGRPARLIVAALGPVEAAEQAVAALGARLADRGTEVIVVDLTESGRMSEDLRMVERVDQLTVMPADGGTTEVQGPDVEEPDTPGPNAEEPDAEEPETEEPDTPGPDAEEPETEEPETEEPETEEPDTPGLNAQGPIPARTATVIRPVGVPSLARGPASVSADLDDHSQDDSLRRSWSTAEVVLILTEVDPAVGAHHLGTWADDVVLIVTAGHSNAERLHTTADLLRTARLNLTFAMLTNTDRTDDSFGIRDSTDEFAELVRARS